MASNNTTEQKQQIKNLTTMAKLGKELKEQFSQAAKSIAQCFSVGSAVSSLISSTKAAVSELKEVDTLLTKISKNNSGLSKTQLKQLGSDAFEISSRYGRNAADYLSGVQKALLDGYKDAKGIAELSMAAQAAGSMTADTADQYITATDRAYALGGSVRKLTEILDGGSSIAGRYALDMSELAEGMSMVSSTAADLGVGADETTAALAAMMSATRQSGSEAAQAFKAILLNIQQVSDEEEGITADRLTEYAQACRNLNVSLSETRNGVLSMRDPMEILRDLSEEYSRLGENDPRKSSLLSSVGGGSTAAQLDALLSQWPAYEAMLQAYADGSGSLAAKAEQTADSWEGSLNRLSNTWTDTIANFMDSEAITAGINHLNTLLSVVNNITDKAGSWATIGLGFGLLASSKNIGKCRMSIRISKPAIC